MNTRCALILASWIGALVLLSTRDARAQSPAPRSASIELLHNTPTVVAVSSSIVNGTDLPEHLVDGSLETAWNSRTGDLGTASIAIRLPRDARVDRIALTAGFVRSVSGGARDLFAMNPRVRHVTIE